MADPYGDPNEGMGLAARVILHLSTLNRLGPNDVATPAYTQRGMGAALSARQGSLVKVLLRLVAGDAVTVERRYVSGVNYRLKVYRLTGLGENLARDLRHRTERTVAPRPAGTWLAPPSTADRSGRETDHLGA